MPQGEELPEFFNQQEAGGDRPFTGHLRIVGSLIVYGAALSVIIECGFFLHPNVVWFLAGLPVAAVLLAVGRALYEILSAPEPRRAARQRIGRLAVTAALTILWGCTAIGIEPAFVPDASDALRFAAIYFALVHMLPAPGQALKLPLPPRLLTFLYGRPMFAVMLSFIMVILFGTVLLRLPRATAEGGRMPLVDALFTATSATCVTGLIVKDTPEYFSRFGHWVILVLIQAGGLGIMTITAFFATAVGRRMRMGHTQLIKASLDVESFAEVHRSVKAIIILTFAIESIGALLLFTQWSKERATMSSPLFCSVFHSVSAFCNAGFSLFSDNLMDYSLNVPINIIVTTLIILGGLGFTVLVNLSDFMRRGAANRRPRLTLHSRLALLATLALIAGGTVLFLAFEFDHSRVLQGLPLGKKILVSYFQSVTTRTAGFNTVDISALNPSTQFGFLILMFIGGCPGSTAGGIKTTTAVLLLLTVVVAARGKDRVTCAGHTIPTAAIWRAVAISVIAVFALSVFVILLLLPISVVPGAEHTSFHDILFEAFSAFGTVGLSTGTTPHLSATGKVLISLLMLMGRVGPLSLAIAFSGRPSPDLVRYPETNVMVG